MHSLILRDILWIDGKTSAMMITRRNALKLAGGTLLGGAALTGAGCAPDDDKAHLWEGEALGAPASIALYGHTETQAKQAFARAQEIIARLSTVFSLYSPDSEISILNREGVLEQASPEMLALIGHAQHLADLTGGAFDISVQPLWALAAKLQTSEIDPQRAKAMWENAYDLVDYQQIHIKRGRVWFGRPGMAITLNGIAQGYISEQVAKALQTSSKDTGKKSGLVNIGEFQAFGERPFTVGIQDPHNVLQTIDSVTLRDQGLATSAAAGGYFDDNLSHIFTPRPGDASPQFASASVVHASATIADGLSTAFTLMNEDAVREIAKSTGTRHVVLVKADRQIIRF